MHKCSLRSRASYVKPLVMWFSHYQRVHNFGLLTKSKKSCDITSILAFLYWLPVKIRVDFKIFLFDFKAIV